MFILTNKKTPTQIFKNQSQLVCYLPINTNKITKKNYLREYFKTA